MRITHLNCEKYTIEGEQKLVYLVDLSANGKKGSCTCPSFKFNCSRQWDAGKEADPCKHILYTLGKLLWDKLNK